MFLEIFDTAGPTVDPSSDPTLTPTLDPTLDPTVDPTSDPVASPTSGNFCNVNDLSVYDYVVLRTLVPMSPWSLQHMQWMIRIPIQIDRI